MVSTGMSIDSSLAALKAHIEACEEESGDGPATLRELIDYVLLIAEQI